MVKSTLESGTEEVPSGLWESVEKRVAATAPVRAGLKPLWKRWAAGIAFACVAACCLLLFTPHREESPAQVAVSAPVMSPGQVVAPTPIETPDQIAAPKPTVAPDPVVTPRQIVASAPVVVSDTAVASDPTPSIIETTDMAAETGGTADTGGIPETVKAAEIPETVEAGHPLFLESEKPERRIRFALTGSAMSGSHSGSRSSIADRMSTSQMDFGTEEKIYENAGTFYMIPVSAGLGVRINFTKHWALGIGLNYTFLRRRFEGSYDYGGTENYFCKDIANNQHYIGIPVNAYYNVVTGNRLKFYVYAGGTIEKCISNNYSFNYYGYNKVLKQSVGGIQASVNAGLGLQFCITDRFGIYLDPSFRYYFRNYLQPKSVRTDQPFQINAELGLRWDL